jgi:hypothetical protein
MFDFQDVVTPDRDYHVEQFHWLIVIQILSGHNESTLATISKGVYY